jgi:hypothetical protein
MKVLVCFLLAAALAIFSTLPLASAQTSVGARRGFTATDNDNPQEVGHRLFKIDLDHPDQTIQLGTTGVEQELEGFFSIDIDTDGNGIPDRSKLFGVAENPDETSTGDPSIVADLTAPGADPGQAGFEVGPTNVEFGTEAGAGWDPISGLTYAIFSDDRDLAPDDPIPGVDFPATKLSILDPATGGEVAEVNVTNGLYLDGLAVAGSEVRADGNTYGVIYASDCRGTSSLYRYNWDGEFWEQVGSGFGVALAEDSGLANYRGVGGNETNLYLLTEGEGANNGRLWTVDLVNNPGTIQLVGDILLAGSGAVVPEDLEGFDIPYYPLVGEQ